MNTESLICSIALETYSECIQFEENIVQYIQNQTVTTMQQEYSFIIQQSSTYLRYLYEYESLYYGAGTSDDCIENSLDQILWTLNNYL